MNFLADSSFQSWGKENTGSRLIDAKWWAGIRRLSAFRSTLFGKWSLLNCCKGSGARARDEIETFPKSEPKLTINTADFENERDFFLYCIGHKNY